MLMFSFAAFIVLVLVGVTGVLVLRGIGTDEATRQAEQVAVVAGRVVEPRLTKGILRGSSGSLLAIETLVNGGVLSDPIVHVKIWDANGEVLYSDVPEQIGSTFQLDASELEAFRTGEVAAEQSDLQRAENRFGQDLGPLLEVSVPVSTPDGTELLFQAYLRFDSVAASARELWTAFLPVLAVALAALTLLQIPLGYRLARRVRESQEQRERLLRHAIESSDMERRRIAADMHDGLVQQLVGLSMSLSAGADSLAANDPVAAASLREAAATTRRGIRSLRSVLMGIYPPTLHRAGLASALSDLAAPLTDAGVATEVHVPEGLDLTPEAESLLFRASQEAIRNVTAHARARNVRVRVDVPDDGAAAVLEVEDDGVGFSPVTEDEARADGHLGLKVLGDLARDAGGTLNVTSTPGAGTRVRLEVPI